MYAYSYHGFQPSSCTPVIETKIGKKEQRKINELLTYDRTTHNQNLREFTTHYMEYYTRKKLPFPDWLKARIREAKKQDLKNVGNLPQGNMANEGSGLGALLQGEGNKLPETVIDEDILLDHGIMPNSKTTKGNDEDVEDVEEEEEGAPLKISTRLGRMDPKTQSFTSQSSKTIQTSYETNFQGTPGARTERLRKRFQTPQERVFFLGGTTGSTTYRRDKGFKGTNPRKRLGNLHSVEEIATTMELANGTAKSTAHVPGYTGHVPTHEKNRVLMHDKSEDYKKQGAKDQLKMNMLHNIPGYAGYIPKSELNYRDRGVKPGKSTLTTSSYIEKPVQVGIAHDHGISTKCMQDFFVMTANTSADGIASAQKFYATYRPLEGMIKLK